MDRHMIYLTYTIGKQGQRTMKRVSGIAIFRWWLRLPWWMVRFFRWKTLGR